MKGIQGSSTWLEKPKTPKWLKKNDNEEIKEQIKNMDKKIERIAQYFGIKN
nr:hypothetical protein [uncultured Campylobacter sp.]